MAEEIQLSGTNEVGKVRDPLGVVGLSIITLGIYAIFWYYFTQKELAEMGRARNTEELGTSPGTSVLAVTLGAFIIVPPFVSIYHAIQRKNAAARLVGAEEGMEPPLLLLIWIFISPERNTAVIVASIVVACELVAIAYVRKRFLAVSWRSSLLQVTLGGALVTAVGFLIGNA